MTAVAQEAVIAYVGLGTNLGNRAANLVAGVRLLLGWPATPGHSGGLVPELPLPAQHRLTLRAVSSIYETAPWGLVEQPAFLNAVCAIETTLSAAALLHRCLAVEQVLGRVRLQRWGPRTLDLDLLLYGQSQIHAPDLTVPHPRMIERAFVLIPLLEVAPDLTLPGGRPLSGFLPGVADQEITRWRPAAAFLQEIEGKIPNR